MASSPAIISFRAAVTPQHSSPEPQNLLSGSPRLTAWNFYSDPTAQFFAGIWSATRGSWRVNYSESEFVHLLEGRIALTDQNGVRAEFGPGDSFVVPSGFVGSWEVIADCRKLYAIFENNKHEVEVLI